METTSTTPGRGDPPSTEQVDAVVLAARVLVAVTARSVAQVEDRVSLPQLRVLVMIASRGPANVGSVARGLGVHPSNATRTCDRIVIAGFLARHDDPVDRRNLILELTVAGQRLVEGVNTARREAIAAQLARLPARSRERLTRALLAFAGVDRTDGPDADRHDEPDEAWILGWTTERPVGHIAGRADPTATE
jgi:DNA-binding MarR family transcriptional regulator